MYTPDPHDAHWYDGSLLRQYVPLSQRHWLFDPLSLTDKLVSLADGEFTVVVLRQQVRQPLFSEASKLGLSHARHALVREVALMGRGEPWVYARTVIPLSSLGGALKRLRYLGSRSLGSALFADPNIRRGELQIASLNTGYLPSLTLFDTTTPTWGRRSVFTFNHKSLLVTEVFLDGLWNNKNSHKN